MSNLTIQQFIGKNKHPGIEQLFGYSQDTWVKLLSHAAFTHILMISNVSLVLFGQRVRTIANTRNNKARRKHILSLLEYTESVNSVIPKPRGEHYSMSSLTCWLSEVMGVLGFGLTVTDVAVRYVTRGNASSLAAVTVGDSKHFISCLRSGVQRYVSKLLNEGTVTKSELTLEWYRTNTDCDNEVLAGFSGCNSHFIEDEVKAFDSGKVFYAIVGNMVYEDHEGPRARARVHVVCDTELGRMCVVDDVYGDKLYVTNIYKALHTSYPGRVYSTEGPGVPDNVTVSTDGVCLGSEIDVYSDQLPGDVYRVINVTDFVPVIELKGVKRASGGIDRFVRNVSKGDPHITYIVGKIEPPTPSVPSAEYIDSVSSLFPNRKPHYYNTASGGDELFILAAISKYYNLPCVKCNRYSVAHLLIDGYSRVVQSRSRISWSIRGYTYTLEYDYILESITLIRHKFMCKRCIYNLKTSKWVDTDSERFDYEWHMSGKHPKPSTPYSVTRHTVHLIYRLMPKPNARIRTMPKM